MESIIIDTSSILFAISNKIDIFKKAEEQLNLKPAVSRGIIKELSAIAKSAKANRKYAKVGLELISMYKIKIEDADTYVDKWILKNAKNYDAVCTNDMKLKRELKARGILTYSVSIGGKLK